MNNQSDRQSAEERFRGVFAHLGAVTAYARRRGSRDADGIAAEAMTIAWRRLADVPADDPLPWLFATARNLVFEEARRATPSVSASADEIEDASFKSQPFELDPTLDRALRALSRFDREALLLVAWEDLTPGQAAKALGINPAAFRVRLLRARRRFQVSLAEAEAEAAAPRTPNLIHLDVEGT
jgi:RNA polymerase sigma factor (sigma-70 family)